MDAPDHHVVQVVAAPPVLELDVEAVLDPHLHFDRLVRPRRGRRRGRLRHAADEELARRGGGSDEPPNESPLRAEGGTDEVAEGHVVSGVALVGLVLAVSRGGDPAAESERVRPRGVQQGRGGEVPRQGDKFVVFGAPAHLDPPHQLDSQAVVLQTSSPLTPGRYAQFHGPAHVVPRLVDTDHRRILAVLADEHRRARIVRGGTIGKYAAPRRCHLRPGRISTGSGRSGVSALRGSRGGYYDGRTEEGDAESETISRSGGASDEALEEIHWTLDVDNAV
mmetsp:Transcript_11399/g.22602  ORF Transcript_11399/g.22602 Transcript_11399/m.22602 type:complete len:279 (+) Transcript_11399:554-1390(+)